MDFIVDAFFMALGWGAALGWLKMRGKVPATCGSSDQDSNIRCDGAPDPRCTAQSCTRHCLEHCGKRCLGKDEG